jgi:hypothetical protein
LPGIFLGAALNRNILDRRIEKHRRYIMTLQFLGRFVADFGDIHTAAVRDFREHGTETRLVEVMVLVSRGRILNLLNNYKDNAASGWITNESLLRA